MFYELYDDSEEEKVLRPYVKKIKAFCLKSEFQFLESKALYWKIAPNNRFSFRAFYYIDQKVPIFHRQACSFQSAPQLSAAYFASSAVNFSNSSCDRHVR